MFFVFAFKIGKRGREIMKNRLWIKSGLAFILAVALVMGVVPMPHVTEVVKAADDTIVVTYVDENGEEQTQSAKVINKETWNLSFKGGWYVVTESMNYSSRVCLSGDSHLILSDGVTMSMILDKADIDGIYETTYPHSNSLYIYGQEKGTGVLDINVIKDTPRSHCIHCKNLYLYGGTVKTSYRNEDGTQFGRGISTDSLTIKGGVLKPEGRDVSLEKDEWGDTLKTKTINLGWRKATDQVQVTDQWNITNFNFVNKFWIDGTETEATADNLRNKTIIPENSHRVNIPNIEYGSVETDTAYSFTGGKVTLKTTANPGYYLKSFSVKAADNSNVALTDMGGGIYTFTMPGKNVTVNAEFDAADVKDLSYASINNVSEVYRYTGQVIDVGAVLKDAKGNAVQESGYNVTIKRNSNVVNEIKEPGEYTLSFTGKGEYKGFASVVFRIVTFEKYDGETLSPVSFPDDNFTLVDGTTTKMSTGYYVVNKNTEIGSRIKVTGDVHLVLCKGTTLNATKGISVTDGNSLTIYCEEGNTGKLIATNLDNYYSGIGGDRKAVYGTSPVKSGNIVIHGGEISARGAYESAGIGAAFGGDAGNITIYGGQITADSNPQGLSSAQGPGIGGNGAEIHLGWCRNSGDDRDYINASRYEGTVTLDKTFVLDEDDSVEATTDNIAGKKIVPDMAKFYDVNFVTNGALVDILSQHIKERRTVTEPAKPMKQGYRLVGWYTTEDFQGDAYDFSTPVTSSFSLYAKWEKVGAISYVGTDGHLVSGFTDYTPLEADYFDMPLPTGTYFAGKDIAASGRITLAENAEVSIILADGKTLTALKGIAVLEGNTFNIFGQSAGTGSLTAGAESGYAVIGGNFETAHRTAGAICIYGGNITATGGPDMFGGNAAAAIGGGDLGAATTIRIAGGTVTATGTDYGNAIGGGNTKSGGTISITGGTVVTHLKRNGETSIGIGGGYNYTGNDTSIVLGYRNADDRVKITSPSYNGKLSVAEGMMMTDGTSIYSGDITSGNINGKTLRAVTHTVRFDTNGGTGSVDPQVVAHGTKASVPTPVSTRTGYTIGKWMNGASEYDFDTPVTGDLNLKIYWLANDYSVRFNKNASNATGSMTDQSFTYDDTAKKITKNTFSRPEYIFTKWNTKPDGSGTSYTDEQAVRNLTSDKDGIVTLYAQWKEKTAIHPVVLISDWTYGGTASTPDVTATSNPGKGSVSFVYFTDAVCMTKTTTANSGAESEGGVPKKAGSWYVRANVAETALYKSGIGVANFSIGRKPVTITGLSVSNKVYDGTIAADVTGTATVDGKVGTDEVGVSIGTAAFADADAGTGKTVTFSGYSLSGKDVNNYTLSAQPASVKANINKADIPTASVTKPATKTGLTYSDSAQSLITAGSVAGNIGTMYYAVTDSSVESAPEFDGTSASQNKKWSVAIPTGTLVGSYNVWYLVVGDRNHNDTSTDKVVATIGKATPVILADNKAVTMEKTITLAPKLDRGTVASWSYSSNDTSVATVDSDGEVTGVAEGTATITISATMADTTIYYSPDAKEITISVTDKNTQDDFGFADATIEKTYGDANFTVTPNCALTDVTYVVSAGTDVAEVNSTTGMVTIKKAGTATITATAAADETYASATASYRLTVNKARVTIAAKNQSIYINDAIPSLASPVLGTHYTVAGLKTGESLGGTVSMKYQKDGADVMPSASSEGKYDIVISGVTVPTGGNYEDEITYTKGTLTINTRPGGGSDPGTGGGGTGGSGSGGSGGTGGSGGGSNPSPTSAPSSSAAPSPAPSAAPSAGPTTAPAQTPMPPAPTVDDTIKPVVAPSAAPVGEPTTTTTTGKDGTETETKTTTYTDGSTMTEEKITKPDGTVTEKTEVVSPDGSKASSEVTVETDGTRIEKAETVSSDGSEITSKEVVTEASGAKTITESSEKTEGALKKTEETVQTVDANGKVTETVQKTTEENTETGKKTEKEIIWDETGEVATTKTVETEKVGKKTVVDTVIENKDGSSLVSTVSTTDKGKETSRILETSPTGNTTLTEQVKQPSGDYSKVTMNTTIKKDENGNITGATVTIDTEQKTGNTTQKASFVLLDAGKFTKKATLSALIKKAASNKKTVALKKATTNAKNRTIMIDKTVKSDGKTYTVTMLKKGLLKGNKKAPKKVVIKATGLTKIEKNAFKGIYKKATITVKASKKQFKKIKKLIQKSGIPKKVKIKRA